MDITLESLLKMKDLKKVSIDKRTKKWSQQKENLKNATARKLFTDLLLKENIKLFYNKNY